MIIRRSLQPLGTVGGGTRGRNGVVGLGSDIVDARIIMEGTTGRIAATWKGRDIK